MTICGTSVYHKQYGNGVITGHEGYIIIVTFLSDSGVERKTKFVFPDAFLKNYLVSSDPRLREYIDSYIRAHTCSVCGRTNTSNKDIDGKMLCDSCIAKMTKTCTKCGQIHLRVNFSSVKITDYPYYRYICKECVSRYVHECDKCHSLFISDTSIRSYNGKVFCEQCYLSLFNTCDMCGEEYLDEQEMLAYSGDDFLDLCPKCFTEKTVICSECGRHVLGECFVTSKYIPAEKHICSSCVSYCCTCGEAIDAEHSCSYFDESYCIDCAISGKKECPVCGKEFIQSETNQDLCPYCTDATKYLEKLQQLDYSCLKAKVMSINDLEYIDRCELFTNLYENCLSLYDPRKANNQNSSYYYLVMNIRGYKVLLTYLPNKISSYIRHSENITMTELRSKRGQRQVYYAIQHWMNKSDHTLLTPHGEVRLLHYPILIRAQTADDKVYGKEWHGRYDYIEIGNYGDTTQFYIIGVMK